MGAELRNDFGSFSFFGQNFNLVNTDSFRDSSTSKFGGEFEIVCQPKPFQGLNDFTRVNFTAPRDI